MSISTGTGRLPDFELLLGGRCMGAPETIPVINPATGSTLVDAPSASLAQLDAAVAAAGEAFATWKTTPFERRRAVVDAIADTIAGNAEELARLLTLETGKPLAAARLEVRSTVDYFRYFTSLSMEPEILEDSETRRVELRRQPLGVVAAIIPWNFPLLLLAFKAPPALLAGNTVVIKPAVTTPLATLRLGRLVADLAPPGVFNVISGGDELGPALTAHSGVRKISFTGSTATGRRVMASAASHLTRITLELGGNDAAIVLDDADVDAIAEPIFWSAFGNSGQVCRAIKRVYAHASVYERLCDRLGERALRTVVGNGMEEGVELGPVQNLQQFARLQTLLDECHAQGTVMPGGGALSGPGFFVRPTIVRDVPADARIVQEEQFGPILPILPFTDLEQAIAQANATAYGLAASVWTRDMDRASDIAARLEAGTVWVNKHIDRTPHLPIAGAKQSGVGVELGLAGLHEFTQTKIVNASRPSR
ncbi:MAG TPA: aldehyde dehydrogenase family protein [Ramlibacter sp.]|nr:aldehyde dehydrogenase family protein [Ramlibacter sp.]